MGIYTIKRRYTDTLWTRYMRIKQSYACQYCGRIYTPDNCGNLHVAHFHGRGHENVRFDEENTFCMCGIPCHQWLDQHKTEFGEWVMKRLGQKRFDLLALRAHIYKKRDDKADAIIIRHLLREVSK